MSMLETKAKKEEAVFPFEGEKHLLTAVVLPYRKDTWRNEAAPALEEYFQVVSSIARFEPVLVLADPQVDPFWVRKFESLKNVWVEKDIPSDDAWARDTLPVFLKKGSGLLGIDFGFNSWGGDYDGLYKPWDEDERIGERVLSRLGIKREAHKSFILEGGSIHTDGEGTLLVTSCCLLSPGRNPQLTKAQIEKKLMKDLRVKKVLWIPNGIYEDETDGHVDNIACFLKPGEVLVSVCADKKDPQYILSEENIAYLLQQKDALGRELKIRTLPVPTPYLRLSAEEAEGIQADGQAIKRNTGRRLAASYVNFYMGEKFILLPQFKVKEDKIAFDFFTSYFQGEKEIIPIYSREILLGGGNIHCITKQIPYTDEVKLIKEEGK